MTSDSPEGRWAVPDTDEDEPVCDRCGARMRTVHCKILCNRCGFMRDCSDP